MVEENGFSFIREPVKIQLHVQLSMLKCSFSEVQKIFLKSMHQNSVQLIDTSFIIKSKTNQFV